MYNYMHKIFVLPLHTSHSLKSKGFAILQVYKIFRTSWSDIVCESKALKSKLKTYVTIVQSVGGFEVSVGYC